MRRLLLVPTTLALAGAAFAQTFPPVPTSGSTVFDGAGLLSPDQERAISDLSRDFQRDTGAPIAVATLSSLDRYEAKSLGIQRYSTALFNAWRVGARKTNGGILLVVAKEDRKVWVALGSDWGHEFDAKTQGIVRGTITPLFKKGQFGEGIVQGCQALVHLADSPGGATGSQGPAGPPVTPAPFGAAPTDAMSSQGGDASAFFGGGILCLALPVLLIVVVVIIAAARRRRSYRPYGGGFGPGPGQGPNVYNRYDDPRDDSGDFLTGVIVGQAMSQPPPVYDPGPSYDSGPSFDSGSSDSGGSDSGGSFDSGSSDGGGGGGDW